MRSAAAITILALAACAAPATDETASTPEAVARGAASSVDTMYLAEELRIGATDGDELGSIAGLAVDVAGHVWVLDGKSRHIRIYSAEGTLIRTAGRPGAGPGELAQPAALLARPDGTIWIDDPGNARMVVMDTSGRLVTNHAFARGCMQARPWPATVDRLGRFVGLGGADCDMVVRWDSTFHEVTRASAPRDPRPPREIRMPGGSATVPFTGEVLWHPAADTTIWALQTDRYRLSRLSLAGDTIRSAEIPFERTRLSEADRALADEFFEELKQEGVVADRSILPRDKPAAVSFFVAPDGTLWVERYTEPDQLGRRWDIVDSASLRTRAVVMSAVPISRFPVPVVRGNRVIAATVDSLGAPHVVVLRRK